MTKKIMLRDKEMLPFHCREEFDMEVTDINGEKRCIRLRKDAKFDDFYSVWNGRQQRRGSSTQSSMRMLHKQASQLWRVDKTDGGMFDLI